MSKFKTGDILFWENEEKDESLTIMVTEDVDYFPSEQDNLVKDEDLIAGVVISSKNSMFKVGTFSKNWIGSLLKLKS